MYEQIAALKVLEALNAEWRWVLPEIETVQAVRSMGNVLLRSANKYYWRACPEELSAVIFAADIRRRDLYEYLRFTAGIGNQTKDLFAMAGG